MPVRDDVRALLSEERGGKKLGDGLVSILVEYLVDEVEVKDVNEVKIKELKV